ncbi:serine dehydratase [Thermosipho melanesiensis]|uniref:L-serine dehydratase n=2 Tax=Thermosipho melanesiensis TaxID=46541 RepID=A6LJV5_THEM4|nr:L-serine ammonia-lyase, iron-sulfur-dependent subunit beta [Thermosipho melanesiensis]ABR30206.1 L-serine dehydratase, iron-sulfur-dependent, beta subunit [Thermosipho melanesiensis BI429]APT73404.1 serine dehydratase [Thermosipho melanesiensis]OOC38218.1 serine dehydratase [Thermosipho melanesiensis]OOC40047.1 serine dehydratase [Thermosipho melanesiensis]OOC40067.1 serine dehydratase [Thermosipho melanesiensis]
MSILKVLGPIMVGPSSSHTLGAIKIARFVHKLIGGIPEEVQFLLHGSFSKTYRGHGTDRALLAGIMGLQQDDPKIKNAFEIAKEKNLKYSFKVTDLGDVHPNTVRIKCTKDGISHEIEGSSIGGGNILITSIDSVPCNLSWDFDTLVIVNKDVPKALEKILETIKVNVANLYLRRINALLERALTIIELDEPIENLAEIKKLSWVYECYFVRRDTK